MEVEEYANMFDHEEKHFYYVNVHNLVLEQIAKFSLGKPIRILDVGCGTGLMATKMEKFGRVTAIDYHPEAVKLAKLRLRDVRRGSVNKLPFRTSSFDFVTCIDVLVSDSIKNPVIAIKELLRVVKPNGYLIIRVSANTWLHLAHDKHVHSVRRFTKLSLKNLILFAGGKLVRLTYIQLPLLLIVIMKYLFELVLPPKKIESVISDVPEMINTTLKLILRLEQIYLRYVDLPAGLGILAVIQKD